MKKSDSETRELQKPEIRGTIEMVISPTNDHTQLLRFMWHLEKICKSDNHSASIISKGGSFDRGAFIAISSRSNSPADLVNEIGNMPEVGKSRGRATSKRVFFPGIHVICTCALVTLRAPEKVPHNP